MHLASHYQYERIDKAAVCSAGKLLVQTPLYMINQIKFDEIWETTTSNIFNADPNDGNLI